MPDLDLMPWKDRLEFARNMADDIRWRLQDAGGEAEYYDIITPVAQKYGVMASQVTYALTVLGNEVEIRSRDPLLRLK